MFLTAGYQNLHGGFLNLGIGHLGGKGAQAYEAVELLLLCRALDCLTVNICGADCLVSLLSAF